MAALLKLKPGLRAKRILQQRIGKVTGVVKANLVQFNNRLLEEVLVPEGLCNPGDRMMTNEAYASSLYRACMTTVEHDPSKFSTLLDILSEYPLLEKDVEEMSFAGEH